MVDYGMVIRLEAKPDRAEELADLLRMGPPLLEKESGTPYWFAVRFSDTSFGLFGAFATNNDREDHLAGEAAAAFRERAADLLASELVIDLVDVIASKPS